MGRQRRDGPRPAVVGVCSFQQVGAADPETLLRDTLAMIDKMAGQAEDHGWRLDLAVLPECSFQFVSESVEEIAQSIDGPIVTAVAERARRYHTYATAPVPLLRDGRVYNSVVLLDRDGEPVGTYDKVFPVMMGDGSLEYGITPGREFPVFDLDFGRVGVQICWDVAFETGWEALADRDAELVLFPTNPASLVALRGRAWRHGYCIAASTVAPPAALVSPTGRVLGTTSEDREVLVQRIDLDFRVLHSNCMWEWSEERAETYAGRVSVDWDSEAHEYLVTSCDPELPVTDFLQAEGLLTGRQRNARNIALQLQARGGPPITPEPGEREPTDIGGKESVESTGVIVAHHTYPVIELAPMIVTFDETVEEMVAGLLNTNSDITSEHFPECRRGRTGQEEATLLLAKPLHDRQHAPVEEVLRRLDGSGFVPEDLPQLARLKDHADELWTAGVHFVGAVGASSVWRGPDGGYYPYLILDPLDRGFHLHWAESEWGGPVWFVVRRRCLGPER